MEKKEFEEGMDRVEKFREGIHKEYGSTVLCKEVRPDPLLEVLMSTHSFL